MFTWNTWHKCFLSFYRSLHCCLSYTHRALEVEIRNHIKCSSNILRIYWFLVNFTKVMKYETRMYIRQIIEVKIWTSLLRQPNRAFSLPNAHSKTILADESRLPKNCSFSFFPPLENSFIVYGKSGYAGSPKTQMGTGGSPSMIILLQSGTTPSLKIAFNLEFENIRASCTLPGHFITTSKKQ